MQKRKISERLALLWWELGRDHAKLRKFMKNVKSRIIKSKLHCTWLPHSSQNNKKITYLKRHLQSTIINYIESVIIMIYERTKS